MNARVHFHPHSSFPNVDGGDHEAADMVLYTSSFLIADGVVHRVVGEGTDNLNSPCFRLKTLALAPQMTLVPNSLVQQAAVEHLHRFVRNKNPYSQHYFPSHFQEEALHQASGPQMVRRSR